ncbi:hypothetical protein BDA96_01G471100 [Sorghum bicolor]|uniref:FAS1 domain-containing protein n=2 Tax=Sorghum bicolor TaxID=4558 RepID=A0A921S4U0_SORBI|nr:uncharacterized protein LOC8078873 [Sorghum bicolor]EER92581.1 hypothetical protein SORBI_3001G442600 [Sorghum bicolor]KAG0551999.1 hypothetical protein BDA96_01G471100 [Sorghum bicolor]|eukprot:XP_002465583.1 uncharacterized protein LOC8078873 [Sorghum bicolor]
MHPCPSWPRYRNVTAAARNRRLSPLRPRLPLPLPPPRLLAVAIAFAFALLFLVLVLLSTTSPPPSPPSHQHAVVARTSSSSAPPSPRCSSAAASLGELGDAMVSMLPRDLPFTVFVPSADSFTRVLRLQGSSSSNASAAAAGGEEAAASDTDGNTYAILSRVLGFSAVPRRLLAADVPPPPRGAGPVRLLDSVSGLRLYASRDARGALVVNGVRSECVDIVRGETVVHVMAGVLMDAEFERSFSAEFDG